MRTPSLVSLFLLGSMAALAQTYVTFSVPGSTNGTYPFAINDNGDVTGNWVDLAGIHGFVRTSTGVFTTFDPPQSIRTYPVAINAAGVITGLFSDKNYNQHGFVRNAEGAIESFDVPGGTVTTPEAINASGQVTGWYSPAGFVQGFVRSAEGSITTFTSGLRGTLPYAINNFGANRRNDGLPQRLRPRSNGRYSHWQTEAI